MSEANMPSTSGAQHRYFAMASTAKGRTKLEAEGKKPPAQSVAKEFVKADRGRHFGRAKKVDAPHLKM